MSKSFHKWCFPVLASVTLSGAAFADEAKPLPAGTDSTRLRQVPGMVATRDFGLRVRELQGQLKDTFSLTGQAPVFVETVKAGSEAERAGLLPHDIILVVNERNLHGTRSLYSILASMSRQAEIRIEILRRGVSASLVLHSLDRDRTAALRHRLIAELGTVQEEARRAMDNAALAEDAARAAEQDVEQSAALLAELAQRTLSIEALGLTVEPISQQLASTLGRESMQGAFIAAVTQASVGQEAGLRVNDLIVGVNGQGLLDPADLSQLLAGTVGQLQLQIERSKKRLSLLVVSTQSVELAQKNQEHESLLSIALKASAFAERERLLANKKEAQVAEARAALMAVDPDSVPKSMMTSKAEPDQAEVASLVNRSPVRSFRVGARSRAGMALIVTGVEYGGHFSLRVPIPQDSGSSLFAIAALETGFVPGAVERAAVLAGLGIEQSITSAWSLLASAEIGASIVSLRSDEMRSTDYTVPTARADVAALNGKWLAGLDLAFGAGLRAMVLTADGEQRFAATPELHLGVIW